MIFDINDLDETLPAPWEWDVKRLVASFVLAARANGLSDDDGRDAAVAAAGSYRTHMRAFAGMDVLDVWYARVDQADILALLPKDAATLASGSPRRHRTAARSWYSPSWSRRPASSPGSGTPRRRSFMPRNRVPPTTWTCCTKCWRTTARHWPRIGAFWSTATGSWMPRTRWSASAASARSAWCRCSCRSPIARCSCR